MAKYTITRSCGHEETVTLFGKQSKRDWAMKQAENYLCKECYKEQHKDDAPTTRLSLNAKILQIQFFGNTYPVKDKLKEIGYKFSRELLNGYFDINPKTGWYKELFLENEDSEYLKKWLNEEFEQLKANNLPIPEIRINTIDLMTTKAAFAANA